MSFFQELPYPVFIGTGNVLQSGGTEDLKPGQVALVNTETYQVIAAGSNAKDAKEVLIAGGSWHSSDKLTPFIGGLKQSVKSQEFLGKDVIEFQRSFPTELTQDIVQIGWDGVNDCDGLTYHCGKPKVFKITVAGEDVYRTFSRPLYRFISVPTGCCPDDDCADGCVDLVDPVKYTKLAVDLINSDPELKYFVKAEAVIDGYTSPSPTHTAYTLTVCDNGDYAAQAAVEAQYPTYSIKRIARNGSLSTYETVKATGLPSAFQPTAAVLQAVCGDCPSGYTFQAARQYYVVSRPITSVDLDDSTAKQNYANTVAGEYSGSGAKFLGQNGSVALVQFYGAVGATVTAVNADSIAVSHEEPAKCVPDTPSTVAWVAGDTKYKPTRYLYLTLAKTCGGDNRLTDVQAAYPSGAFDDIVDGSIVVSASGECADTYRITQLSKEALEDGCLSPAAATYGNVQSFEGTLWSTEDPCPSTEAPDLDVLTGIRLTGSYIDTRFGNCSFDVADYYSQSPIRVGISEVNEDGSPCSEGAKVTTLQRGTKASQSGEWLIRQYLKSIGNEVYNIWANEPRLREVYDQNVLSFIDRNKLYVVYYIVYKQNRDGANWDSQHTQDKFETIVAFPWGTDTNTFEQVFGGYFAQYDVFLKNRG